MNIIPSNTNRKLTSEDTKIINNYLSEELQEMKNYDYIISNLDKQKFINYLKNNSKIIPNINLAITYLYRILEGNNNVLDLVSDSINKYSYYYKLEKEHKINVMENQVSENIWEKRNPKIYNPENRTFINKQMLITLINKSKKGLNPGQIVDFISNPKNFMLKHYAGEIDDYYKNYPNVSKYVISFMVYELSLYRINYINDTFIEFWKKNKIKITKKIAKTNNWKADYKFSVYLQELLYKYGTEIYEIIYNQIYVLFS